MTPNVDDKTSEALKLINTEKFIQQNNFIPVPNIMLNTYQGQKPMLDDRPFSSTQPFSFNFYQSGENLTKERFIKSRQQAKRNQHVPEVTTKVNTVAQHA